MERTGLVDILQTIGLSSRKRSGRRSNGVGEVISTTEPASVFVPYQKRKCVERAERSAGELFTEGVIKEENVVGGMTAPVLAEGAFLIGSGAFTPYDAKTDEVGVSDALHG